jgi:hypothetical protein
MKTIAILGIVFLPPTFVASLFSMDMFNWEFTDNKERSSLAVSSSIWIYFVVAVPLTIVTLIAWLLWSRSENSRSSERLMVYRTRNLNRPGDAAEEATSGLTLSEKIV